MTAKRQMLIRSSATCEKTSNRYLAFGYLFWVLTNYSQNISHDENSTLLELNLFIDRKHFLSNFEYFKFRMKKWLEMFFFYFNCSMITFHKSSNNKWFRKTRRFFSKLWLTATKELIILIWLIDQVWIMLKTSLN